MEVALFEQLLVAHHLILWYSMVPESFYKIPFKGQGS
jgi:hypothetical protein